MDKVIGGVLAAAFGFGGLFAGFLWLLKQSLTSWVDMAAKKVLQEQKADLDRLADNQRQDFARTLERERQGAAADLEKYKAELTFGAEVRRQVAAKKVEALLKIVEAGTRLRTNVVGAKADAVSAEHHLDAFVDLVLNTQHLLTATRRKDFLSFAEAMHESRLMFEADPTKFAAIKGSLERTEEFLALVRADLGIELRQEVA